MVKIIFMCVLGTALLMLAMSLTVAENNPAVEYAQEKGLSGLATDGVAGLGKDGVLDENGRKFIDLLSEQSPSEQVLLAVKYAFDGEITEDELNEILKLALGPSQAKRRVLWSLHFIDDSSRGADGVKLADVNDDGLMDIVTGWEEGGIVRVCINPGSANAKEKWPAVTVGKAGDVEDAVFVDLNANGEMDVVSSCEGEVRTMFVHWAPDDRDKYLNPLSWKTEAIPASQGVMRWMFCIPMQVDEKKGIDLVAGGKDRDAKIGWFEAPTNSLDISGWKWHPISNAGWIMSLFTLDMDGDGDLDIVTSDRYGDMRGCRWLENPGPGLAQDQYWTNHYIGGRDKEVMFMTVVDLDQDGILDILTAIAEPAATELIFFRRVSRGAVSWEVFSISLPENTGFGKAVAVGDIDIDGKPDIVFTSGRAEGKFGVMWMSYNKSPTENVWEPHHIAGTAGSKFDLVELLDLDGDGDLDVITCEEGQNMGVIWYENPTIDYQLN